MIRPPKKNQVTCLGISSDLAEYLAATQYLQGSPSQIRNGGSPTRSPVMSLNTNNLDFFNLRTPGPRNGGNANIFSSGDGSPVLEYLSMPPVVNTPAPERERSSRWKEDWEELELLVCACSLPPHVLENLTDWHRGRAALVLW